MLLSGNGADPADRKVYEKAARQQAARQHGVPLQALRVVGSVAIAYPLLGTTVFDCKVLHVRNGKMYAIALDQGLEEVNIADLDAAEQQLRDEQSGRLHPELQQRLADAPDDERIRVILWLKDEVGAEKSYQRPSPQGRLSRADVKATRDAAREERAMDVDEVNGPVRERIQQMGFATTVDYYSPAVYAELTPDAIREAGFWDEVDMIYPDQLNEPALNIAGTTIYAAIVHSRGITGAGSSVGVVEVGGGIPYPATNPYLPGVVRDTTNTCLSSHSTGVAGIIKSSHSTYRGIAYKANVRVGGSCTGDGWELLNAASRAYTWGADVINNSWGGLISSMVPGIGDKFFDDMVINKHVNIVAAAGNRAPPCAGGDARVISPGLGYNTITVGNFNDINTVSWADDVMHPCSSYVDPFSSHGDREKPEIAAPGTSITSTTTASPWVGAIGSGTSFAAPMVSGTIALMIDRNPALDSWPEAVKAILLATATHNIEGATRLSDKDGAGGIVASRADYVALNTSVYGRWGAMAYSCTTADPYSISMSLTAGKKTRVVIVWDQNTAYASYGSQPSADLDLQIYRGTTLIAGSSSWDNTYEIAEFTPSTTGIYTLKINRFRCSLTPKWLGWAWYRLP
ncbi:MAG: S8 family serine peptidase [Thermodesulfobacteriota bacterium]